MYFIEKDCYMSFYILVFARLMEKPLFSHCFLSTCVLKCPTKPFQLALGQRGRYGPPLPITSHTEKPIPAVPVGSADLNQGPTASPMGRGDVIQVLLPNMARTATHKPRTNKDKVTELHLATYNVRTLSDECHLVSL